MKTVSIILLIAAGIAASEAYNYMIPTDPRHSGVCFYHGMYLEKGVHYPETACQKLQCNEDGSIYVEGCNYHDSMSCRILDPLNLDKPYPGCCKTNPLCYNAEEGQQYYRPYPIHYHGRVYA